MLASGRPEDYACPVDYAASATAFRGLLQDGEAVVAAAAVRITGTASNAISWGHHALASTGPTVDPCERAAREGTAGSLAAAYPACRGLPGTWLLAVTTRRLAVWYPSVGPRKELVWSVPASTLVHAAPAGRHRLTVPTIRLNFADGSAIRLNCLGHSEFLLRLAAHRAGRGPIPPISVGPRIAPG